MKSKVILGAIKVFFIAIIIAITLFPIYWMIVTSLEPWELVLTWPPSLIPTHLTTEYWSWAGSKFLLPLRNSLIIAGLTTLISILIGFPAGYSFARFKLGGSTLPFWILSIRFLPGIVPCVAFYILFRTFGLLDTQIAVIIAHLT